MQKSDINNKPSVLVVDDVPENIAVLKGVLADTYQVRVAINGVTALKIAQQSIPDIILLDVMMPEMDGYEVCRQLKANKITKSIPVIFVTATTAVSDEQHGFELGGVDYIAKPVNAAIVQARVKTHLMLARGRALCERKVLNRTKQLEESQRSTIFMLGEAGHYNDNDTGAHIWRMAAYSRVLAKAAGWSSKRIELLELASPMHDTGKIGISDTILQAPRKLTPEEWAIMQTHTLIGHQILKKSATPLFALAAEVALNHHEKWDGSGYPHGLIGERIPESGRIVAIADVFDALTMKRPYKEAWSATQALQEIEAQSGRHFDPKLVKIFIEIEDKIRAIKAEWDSKTNRYMS